MKGKSWFALLIAVGFFAAIEAQAAIVGVSGSGVKIFPPPPLNTNDDSFPNATLQQGFDEQQGVAASQAYTSGGNIDMGFNIADGTPNLDSHMIFFDVGPAGTSTGSIADWTFDNPIVGIFSNQSGSFEAGSNLNFGLVGITYPGQFPLRGLEVNDMLTLLMPDVLRVEMNVASPGDWIRVVTAPSAIPLPGAVWLFISAIVGLVSFSRIKRGAVPA